MIKKHSNIKQFLDSNDVPFKPNERSEHYWDLIYAINKQNKQVICVLYFMKTSLNIDSVTTMFLSAQKSRDLMSALFVELHRKGVTEEWEPLFKKFIEDSIKRINYIQKIMKEDLYLTEWYPFFQDIGFGKLFDIKPEVPGSSDNAKVFEKMKEDFEIWKKENPVKLSAHMAKATTMIEALRQERERNREKDLAERRSKMEAKKTERTEMREHKKYDAERDKRERKLDREFERYYR